MEPHTPEGDAAVGARRGLQTILVAQALSALGVHDPLQAELGEAPVHLRIGRLWCERSAISCRRWSQRQQRGGCQSPL